MLLYAKQAPFSLSQVLWPSLGLARLVTLLFLSIVIRSCCSSFATAGDAEPGVGLFLQANRQSTEESAPVFTSQSRAIMSVSRVVTVV